jgi:hypothetical protein
MFPPHTDPCPVSGQQVLRQKSVTFGDEPGSPRRQSLESSGCNSPEREHGIGRGRGHTTFRQMIAQGSGTDLDLF